MHGHDAIMFELLLGHVFELEYDYTRGWNKYRESWIYKRWLSESNQVMALFFAHIIAVWDQLCADCVSLIYKIGNVKLTTINEMCLIFGWY